MSHRVPVLLVLIALMAIPNVGVHAQDQETETKMRAAGAAVEVYKTTEDAEGAPVSLKLYVFYPDDHKPTDRRSAIVFFFGGGWKNGTPNQFLEHCKYLASRGMVAMTADYRVLNRQGTKALKCVADGKSAVRWIREQADRLGVDPDRIVAGGGSAGGHVAACTGVIEGLDESGENTSVSSRPNAMALFNPAVVLAKINDRPPLDPEKLKGLAERMGTDPRALSPVHHVDSNAPPTILFHGKADETVPYWTAEAFCQAMKKAGNACELIGFEGQGHGFFNHGRGDNSNYQSTIRELDQFLVSHGFLEPQRTSKSPQLTTIDLGDDTDRQVIVDREPGQYLGHPTTCLLEDGKTMLCVYPKGHGRGGIVYKRSDDGGLTWSDRLPTPENWSTSKEVPTLHRVIGPDGTKRIIMWSGLYPARLAVSENDGLDWSPLKPVGDWGGIVVMGFVEPLKTGPGHYLAMFHDDGRFFTADGKRSKTFTLYKSFSTDGGLTWSAPESVYQSSDVHLCEPGCIRSPDGKRLAVLLRENARRKNSHIIFSDDEGKTWSSPRELPLALTGDRHTGKYTADGRLFISYRCQSPVQSRKDRPFEGDWVGWVGTWDDLVNGRDGQYFVRLGDNTKGADTAYPGVEVLPDDTIVTTTYGHWIKGEQPYIMSVRLKLSELDQK
ncbi:alpha/beta hydrolase fold domain-containing protein [Planctomycetes bacterium TBK1r]|uniref:Lipase 2 n=1 Tax=Stieleria magnilauensis TaxID=2527963 RepID=A0ABX5XMB9_9BACT|nr:Lipase 2 [Planctomycetes bacterium TBK1r]